MGRLRRTSGVALFGLAAVACAQATAPTERSSSPNPSVTGLGPPLSYGGTLAIGPEDVGMPISLGAGNTLVFTVGSDAFPSGLAWGITSAPAGYLIASSHSATPPFRFLARRAGIVVLRITVGPGCAGGPLGQSTTPCSPGTGPDGALTRVWTYDIKIFGRGG
jgi:hypothetical protein